MANAERVEDQKNDGGGRGHMLKTPTDKVWWEVDYINSYAMTMAYLSMGVRGLAYLVITWTTVVLLGGFVSMLGTKDFWGLTVIILAQTAGVFDVFLREKLSQIWYVYKGLLHSNLLSFYVMDWDSKGAVASVVLLLKMALKALVITVVMCPLAAVYISGLFISTGISLWRLIEQDYGHPAGGANLKPALKLLYSLAFIQGMLFCYRCYFSSTEKDVVSKVAKGYNFDGGDEVKLISDYTEDTKTGCEKDPTFANGRNLITYAVGLIKSEEAPAQVISGVRILAKLLALHMHMHMPGAVRMGQHMLIKQLIGSTSSCRILHYKLVQMLDPRCPYNLTIRENAAMIVVHLAGDIHLEQLPRAIHCITSLLNEEYRVVEPYQRDWLLERFDGSGSDDVLANYRLVYGGEEPYRMSVSSYTALAVQGLQILRKLASDDENRRVMSSTQGLVSKITAPLSSDELHRDHHREWSPVAVVTFQLLDVLIHAPGKTGQKLKSDISNNNQTISAMENTVLNCDECSAWLQRRAIAMLSYLFLHTSSTSASSEQQSPSRRLCFIRILIRIFADHKKNSYTRKKAGAELVALSSASKDSKATVTFILEDTNGGTAVQKLARVLLYTNDKILRTSAAVILENLCSHYNKDDQRFEKLKGGIIEDIMPKVLGEILCYSYYSSTGNGKPTAAEADNKEFSPLDADLEQGGVSQDNAQNATSSSQLKGGQQEGRKLQEALLSLCDTVHKKFVSEADPDLARRFDDIAAAICLEQKRPVKTFTHLVEEAQQLLDANKAQEWTTVPAPAAASAAT